MKIGIGQINTTVGDFRGNLSKIKRFSLNSDRQNCDLVIFPELAICGYPPKDFLEDKNFIESNLRALNELISFSKKLSCALLVGYLGINKKRLGKPIFNSAALIQKGKLLFTQNKSLLPTYDVFDEGRYFEPSDSVKVCKLKGTKLGISICEDIWNDEQFWKTRMYKNDPILKLVKDGAEILINISSSPYYVGKRLIKEAMLKNIARKHKIPLVYVNLVGGNDDLIFEGRSLFINENGDLKLRMNSFKEDFTIIDTSNKTLNGTGRLLNDEEEVLGALALGVRDYVNKCGFKQVVIGLSGGVDSALVAYIAVLALGKNNVQVVNMPTRFSSQGSIDDSLKLAQNLGVKYSLIPIQNIFENYLKLFKKLFKGRREDTTEENIQARIRANILMAISNKLNKLVLSCGNKSEIAVGYCTLYGDLSGGLAVISDLPKTTVYKLTKHINRSKEVIPNNILTKAPSAELKPNQKDQDTLPPYNKLDTIIKAYIENDEPFQKISNKLKNPSLVKEILNKILLNEYKRNQAPPGLKVTTKAFGYGRRFPIAHKFRF